ncbi:hypothetical protein [Brevundimonas vancanneytii]|uniref:Uncharacterized protein n=1 Tax=Brevundimonas vancanneytii TaxID=1325724 RepID=A0A4P1KHB4_9CAUL|nr:hypothetical protein [Brevundimonas vancanneytii]VTO19807.1 Uncharacterised protein [Brevundimonas vancanneytii]
MNLKLASIGCLAIGMMSLLRATFFDTAPEGTHNIGLMQAQMLWSNFSALMLVLGALFFIAHYLGEKLAMGDRPR